MTESRLAWLWQAAMAAAIVAQLGGVKLGPQLGIVAALAVVAVLQRRSMQLRTAILVASSWAGMAVITVAIAIAAAPSGEHPTMPIGEVLIGFVAATIAAIAVLWLRVRRAAAEEPRLGRVVELFAVAAAVRVLIDRLV